MTIEQQLEDSGVAPGVAAILYEALKFALDPGCGVVLDLTKVIDHERIVGSRWVYVHVDRECNLQITDVADGPIQTIKHGTKVFIHSPEAPELKHG